MELLRHWSPAFVDALHLAIVNRDAIFRRRRFSPSFLSRALGIGRTHRGQGRVTRDEYSWCGDVSGTRFGDADPLLVFGPLVGPALGDGSSWSSELNRTWPDEIAYRGKAP